MADALCRDGTGSPSHFQSFSITGGVNERGDLEVSIGISFPAERMAPITQVVRELLGHGLAPTANLNVVERHSEPSVHQSQKPIGENKYSRLGRITASRIRRARRNGSRATRYELFKDSGRLLDISTTYILVAFNAHSRKLQARVKRLRIHVIRQRKAFGETNKKVAAELGIHEKTVAKLWREIKKELGNSNAK